MRVVAGGRGKYGSVWFLKILAKFHSENEHFNTQFASLTMQGQPFGSKRSHRALVMLQVLHGCVALLFKTHWFSRTCQNSTQFFEKHTTSFMKPRVGKSAVSPGSTCASLDHCNDNGLCNEQGQCVCYNGRVSCQILQNFEHCPSCCHPFFLSFFFS